MTPKQRDRYYLRKYGITLARYNEMLAEYDNSCHICGWKPKAGQRALAVEHDHRVAQRKIYTKKVIEAGRKMWGVWHEGTPPIYFDKRRDGIATMRQTLGRLSVRGLVCWKCNALLKKSRDNPDILNNAALYLRAYQNKLNGVKISTL